MSWSRERSRRGSDRRALWVVAREVEGAVDRSAHCAVGRVRTPRNAHGRLVVTRQSLKAGTIRAVGSKVSLTLGAPAKPGKHTR